MERRDVRHPDGRWLRLYGEGLGAVELPREAVAQADPSAIHQRYNALRDTWVAVSPARNDRPHAPSARAAATSCPLCPGGPEVPVDYAAAVFDNRFPSFAPAPPEVDGPSLAGVGPLVTPSRGRCEVVLYTPTHTGSLATLDDRELARVIAIWVDRTRELWEDPAHRLVTAFENRGEAVGATLSHPHGQIYALDHVPPLIRDRCQALRRHRERTGTSLSQAVVDADVASDRCLLVDDAFVTAVPFAPDWPFEVHVRARRDGVRRLTDLHADELASLAVALRTVVTAYDQLWETPMAYLMVCHEAPAAADGSPEADHRLAFEFLPPHRSPTKLKVRASVETALGVFINDTLPEDSADLLRQAIPAAETRRPEAIPRMRVTTPSRPPADERDAVTVQPSPDKKGTMT